MKRTIIILILILGIAFGVYGQSSGPMDLVILLDTSASMSNSYRETTDYLIGPFLKEFLRIGDTVHLISFSDTTRVEISRRIAAVEDVEAVIGRILLMYPLYPSSNLSGALNFAEQYTTSLPGNRSSKLILVSDGDVPGTQDLVNASSGRLKSRGSELQYIKVPVTGNGPSSGRPAQTSASSPAAPPVVPPAVSQTVSPTSASQAAPVSQAGQAAPPAATTQAAPPATAQTPPSSQTSPSSPSQTGTAGQTPAPSAQGPGAAPSSSTQTTPAQPPAAGAPPAQTGTAQTSSGGPSPAAQSSSQAPAVSQSTQPASSSSGQGSGSILPDNIPLPLLIALAILALLLLGLLIFFAVRHLHNSPNRVIAQAAAPMDAGDRVEAVRQGHIKDAEMMGTYAESQRNQPKPMPKDKADTAPVPETNDGQLMLNLFVEDQNTAIGRRNIHAMKGGYTFSVGGGKSDFLIFLVPIPPHIADVQINGNNCTFIPRKPQYFPDIGSQIVSNCIGKNIRVISDKHYELHIRMERYEDPLKALNKMLHSIQAPG